MNKEKEMNNFAIIAKEFSVSYEKAFSFIADPRNLPKWTVFFREADERSALLEFPDGEVRRIPMKTISSIETGLIDWHMTMLDNSIYMSWSRLVGLKNGNTLYNFMFYVRPVPPDEVQATLAEQKRLVETEFNNLEQIFQRVI